VGEPAFARSLEAHTLSSPVGGNSARLLLNGDQIFPAMLSAIRQARTTITFANFIYEDGPVASDMASALAERCRAGVRVHVLLDAVGSSDMPDEYRRGLVDAGCSFARFHSLNPFAIKRINHRNHRRILVVDGRVGSPAARASGVSGWGTAGRADTGARPMSGSRDRWFVSCRPRLPRTGATPRATSAAVTRISRSPNAVEI
jgi:hypothetical protein